MSETEQVEQSEQHNLQADIQGFCKAKADLKAAKASRKEYEKKEIETEVYVGLAIKLKTIKADMKDLENEAIDKLHRDDEDFSALRKLTMELEEELAHQRERVATSMADLPPEPLQMSIDFGEGEANVNITTHKQLFVDGKDQKI